MMVCGYRACKFGYYGQKIEEVVVKYAREGQMVAKFRKSTFIESRSVKSGRRLEN